MIDGLKRACETKPCKYYIYMFFGFYGFGLGMRNACDDFCFSSLVTSNGHSGRLSYCLCLLGLDMVFDSGAKGSNFRLRDSRNVSASLVVRS